MWHSPSLKIVLSNHSWTKSKTIFDDWYTLSVTLNDILFDRILQMVEAGLVIYWKKHYGAQTGGKCGKVKQSDTGPKSLNLTDLQGAFIILAIGSGLASLVFLLEQFPFFYRFLCSLF
jgi:hypothetical protein